ncbi:Saccharopine dehydrogenase [NADP(+), L-glutamate-forming] [Cyberlindnera fabianii]|uniref:Saccharopine dehydrogenase [NADP(+), L-glutamate-forming] n=1 Tax=Cyberlindnera fabianii TaxID=36022 RepID=A0A1V2KYL1_CYBFA|nr:Saccharopine dehydrogenase [NADP(+), L-glutamate-forming] [Cyberlindnera fabianii]
MVKKVLLLGSGFVAKPTVDILSKTDGVEVTVACRTLEKAKALAGEVATAISLDVSKEDQLDAAVSDHDLVISLIPYIYHATVVKSAIKNKKNVVTTSYISPALKELEDQINEAGIIVFNEIGLDPGLDHLYAVKTIDEVHKAGGKIKSFISYCGGLVAPEDANNPLGYKFSWSARGVLLALRNSATFYKDGEKVTVDGPELMGYTAPYTINELTERDLVAYPNRDSTTFRELYKIPEADTVIRGTLRFAGFPEFIKVLVDLGLLKDDESEVFSKTIAWNEALYQYLGAKSSSSEDLIAAIESKTKFASEEAKKTIIDGFNWFGLLSDKKIIPKGNPLDTLCALFEGMLQLEKGERDLVLLQHKFGIENADGTTETRTSTLVDYGAPTGSGYSSMAKLVGTPCAVASQLILRDELPVKKGLIAPYSPEINDPIIKTLKEDYSIELTEKTL